MKQNSKYTRLVSNTILFGISTFSSKVLSFMLTRLYTGVMDTASFGTTDLLVSTANLLIPLVSLGISNAVIRFGLEETVPKAGVFTGGLASIGMGFGALLVFSPLLGRVQGLHGYMALLCLYVLTSSLRTLCHQFVRARMLTRLYAIDGILSTLYTLGFSVLFLVGLRMDVKGYLLSIICADLLSAAFLFLVGRIGPYFNFRAFNLPLLKNMLRYSLPLVPASMSWWIANSSDRFFIYYMVGDEANGLYSAANRIPFIITIISTIFTEAWQLSVVTDGQDEGKEVFFSRIFSALMSVSFVAAGLLILLCRPIMSILVGSSFFEAWRYIPLLILAAVFACLVNFQNSVYMLEKRSGLALATMACGALANLVLNGPFILLLGAQGAALATFLSYLLVFVIRAYSTRKYVRVNYAPLRMLLNTQILITQGLVLVTGQNYDVFWCTILMVLLVVINFGGFYSAVKELLAERAQRAKKTIK